MFIWTKNNNIVQNSSDAASARIRSFWTKFNESFEWTKWYINSLNFKDSVVY